MSISYSQLQKILASDGQSGDIFGAAVSISMYGDVALVGAPNDVIGGVNTGSAYIYVYSDTTWVQHQKLIAGDGGANDSFGTAVALSSNGNTALIGANGDTINGNPFQGSAYVFVRSDTGAPWTFQAKLSDNSGNQNNGFGFAVALSADGNIAVVGSPFTGSNSTTVIFFERNGASWSQQSKWPPQGNFLGFAVALSALGDVAMAGAPGNGNSGQVYVFTRSDSFWSDQTSFTSNDVTVNDNFGKNVALSGDGKTVLVGAPQKNSNQGAAYAFIYSDGAWSQQYKFLPSDVIISDQFGASVALGISPDGYDIALICASGGKKSYIFKHAKNGNVWTQTQVITASDSALSGNFGDAVALTGNGLIGLIGASAFNVDQGSAYFFGAQFSVTPASGINTTLISFFPDILISVIVLYGGIISMFLFNAFQE